MPTLSVFAKDVFRDALAFGSVPFYAIVIIRGIIGEYWLIVLQLLVALAFVHLLQPLLGKSNLHVARTLVLTVFTSMFYNEVMFTLFATAILLFVAYSAHCLEFRGQNVSTGIISGAAATAVAYALF